MKAVLFAIVMAVIGAISGLAHAQMIIEVLPVETESKVLKKFREAKESAPETTESAPGGAPQAAPAVNPPDPVTPSPIKTAAQPTNAPAVPANPEAVEGNLEGTKEDEPQAIAASLPIE